MEPALEKAFLNCPDLPVIPALAVKITRLLDGPKVELEELLSLVQYEQATVVKILSVANSPAYGFVEKISTLKTAATLLGFRQTATLALTFSLAQGLKNRYPEGLNYQYFWQRSIVAAAAARVLAKYRDDVDAEAAFLSALLQDIGVFIFVQTFKEKYLRTVSGIQRNHIVLAEAERLQFGVSHNEVGAWYLEAHHLPFEIVMGIRCSHSYEKNLGPFSACVAASSWIADLWVLDANQFGEIKMITETMLQRFTKRTLPAIDAVMKTVTDVLPDVASWFDATELMQISEEKRKEIEEKAGFAQQTADDLRS